MHHHDEKNDGGAMLGRSDSPDAILPPREAALRLSVSTLAKMRVSGRGPRFVKLANNKVAYRMADVNAWVTARVVPSTSCPPANEPRRLSTRSGAKG